ncbi:MAG: carboxypeptidase-like regulatory domain-containing protein [Bacteroidales bacterium]|nr:carboxypeptidase-like regulatory domain-containing protein [Bacteroidales bacterium]
MVKVYLRIIILSFLLIFSVGLFGQGIKYSGLVQDEKTKEALAFVNLISDDGHFGTTTDIDGKFSIVLPSRIDSIRFSYLGYETRYILTRNLKGPKTIFVKSIKYNLAEYEVFPGPNPAHRIILNAIRNRDKNNPKKLASFTYTTYDKMVVSVDTTSYALDSVSIKNDSVKALNDFFKNKDVFLMETVVEKKFLAPDKSNERVIATKVSGLKDPIIIYLVSQIQSTSFYDEIIQIVGKKYINPISKGSLNKYYFQLEDTLYSGSADTVYTISFRPNRNTNFEGMQGIVHISTNKWAIVNVKAEPAKENQGITIQIQQKYDLVDGIHWFPVQLNTTITFASLSVSSGGQQSRLLGIGKTYIRDIELNTDLVKKAFSYMEIEVDPNAGYRNEEQWNSFRRDSLSLRDKETYKFMDSIGKEAEFDKTLKELETLLTGKIGLGKVDLFLNRFMGFNSFEGFWFGIGMQTNKRFSKDFAVGGYYAYSLKDKISKIGIKTTTEIYKPKEIKAYVSYLSDNMESGGVSFFQDESSLFDPLAFQEFFINRMNYTVREEAGLSGRMFNYLQSYAGFSHGKINNLGEYYFQRPVDIVPITDFQLTEIKLRFRFAYKEKYFNNGRILISMGTKYPVFWFNYSQGFSGILGGCFDFKKMDFQMRKSFYIKYLGQTNISLKAGLVLGDVPYATLHSGGGTYRPFALFAPGSFGTMRANEFLSDRYISLFISHNFGSLLFRGKKFKPEFEIGTNIGFGWLKHPKYHQNIDFKTMEEGYFESGLMINNLIKLQLFNVGVGAMYRYGPYSFDSFQENVAYKFTLAMPL